MIAKVLSVLFLALVCHPAFLAPFGSYSGSSASTLVMAQVINCSDFDPSQIKLVTFDTFAALTLLVDSLTYSVEKYLPELNGTQVDDVVDQWVEAYSEHMGMYFNLSVTGPYPFRWMVNTSLHDILENLDIYADGATITALEDSWGYLIPREESNITLVTLQNNGFEVGPLSNGDYYTLHQAFKAFEPLIPNYVFSSDYPVMCFKNCPTIYQHVLNVTGYTNQQYLHVAGSFYDGEGARSAGMFSAVLNSGEARLDARLRSRLPPRDTTYPPCFVLEQLTDILPILGLNY